MNKPTIYLDTNIISVLHYHGTDLNGLARRLTTRDWWDTERRGFELIGSVVTELELAEGVYDNQRECLRLARPLKYVPLTAEVRHMATHFLEQRLVPQNKPGDAAQLAVAVAHHIDYLLAWNYAHLANPATQTRGEAVVAKLGYRMPWLVSPDSIPRLSLEQTIRRPSP